MRLRLGKNVWYDLKIYRIYRGWYYQKIKSSQGWGGLLGVPQSLMFSLLCALTTSYRFIE